MARAPRSNCPVCNMMQPPSPALTTPGVNDLSNLSASMPAMKNDKKQNQVNGQPRSTCCRPSTKNPKCTKTLVTPRKNFPNETTKRADEDNMFSYHVRLPTTVSLTRCRRGAQWCLRLTESQLIPLEAAIPKVIDTEVSCPFEQEERKPTAEFPSLSSSI